MFRFLFFPNQQKTISPKKTWVTHTHTEEEVVAVVASTTRIETYLYQTTQIPDYLWSYLSELKEGRFSMVFSSICDNSGGSIRWQLHK